MIRSIRDLRDSRQQDQNGSSAMPRAVKCRSIRRPAAGRLPNRWVHVATLDSAAIFGPRRWQVAPQAGAQPAFHNSIVSWRDQWSIRINCQPFASDVGESRRDVIPWNRRRFRWWQSCKKSAQLVLRCFSPRPSHGVNPNREAPEAASRTCAC